MDARSRKKYLRLTDKLCSESLCALQKDLSSKTRAKDLLENTRQSINTVLLKKCHDDMAKLGSWISEFSFKNGNLCMSSNGIETFGGAAVSTKDLPEIFKARLSRKDKCSLCLLHDAIKVAIRESKEVRRIYDKSCSSHKCQDLLISILDVDNSIYDVID